MPSHSSQMKEKTQVNKIRHEENSDSNKIQNVSRKYLDSKVLYLKHHIIQNTGKYRRSSKAQDTTGLSKRKAKPRVPPIHINKKQRDWSNNNFPTTTTNKNRIISLLPFQEELTMLFNAPQICSISQKGRECYPTQSIGPQSSGNQIR